MIMKTNRSIRFILTSVLVIACFISLSSLKSYEADSLGSIYESNDISQIVEEYLNKMRMSSFDETGFGFTIPEFAGYDPDVYNFQSFNDPGFRYCDVISLNVEEVTSKQYDFIIQRFGKGAWVNAEYKIERVKCPETDGRVSVKIMDNLVRYKQKGRSLPKWHRIKDITTTNSRSERCG